MPILLNSVRQYFVAKISIAAYFSRAFLHNIEYVIKYIWKFSPYFGLQINHFWFVR